MRKLDIEVKYIQKQEASMTIKQALTQAVIMLKNENIEAPKNKARMLLEHTLKKSKEYLIIYDKLPVPLDYIDLVYLVTCLLTNLIYSINKKVIYETKKLFRKKICRKKDHLKINTFDHSSKSSNTKNSETFDSF